MIINISEISKSFLLDGGLSKEVFNNLSINLNFEENNFISLIAPSGFGKSTLLKIIAGLINPDSGKITVKERQTEKPLEKVIYIPGEAVSIPWLSVKKNIEFGIQKDQLSDERTKFIISLIGLEGYDEHIPHKKSIGFRFRITLGRSLYSDPEIILIDDPFGKLDGLTKEEVFLMLKDVIEESNTKFLLATSNLIDAFFLSDEIMIISDDKNFPYEKIKVEKKFSHINEMLVSDYFQQYFNKIQSKLSAKSGFRI